jgi:hypothetical protein
MTDSHAGYVVALDENLREDDSQAVLAALRLIKGVIAVEPVVGTSEMVIAKERVDREWRDALWALVKNGPTEP